MARIDKEVFIQNIKDTTTVLQQLRVCIEQIKEIIDESINEEELEQLAETVSGISDSLNAHKNNKNNPHEVTKSQVGLANVDNTSDANKPISNAEQAALALKADKSTIYTKTEVDSELALKADKSTTYTKTEVDGELALKADKAITYTKTEVDNDLALKADKSTTYTKTEVDTALSSKQATLISGTNIKTINSQSILGSGNLSINDIGLITLNNTSGTLTDEQYNECLKPFCIIKYIKTSNEIEYLVKNQDLNTDTVSNAQFEFYGIRSLYGNEISLQTYECMISQINKSYSIIYESKSAYLKTDVNSLLNAKQNTLTAGTGIQIQNDIISATGGGGGSQLYKHDLYFTLYYEYTEAGEYSSYNSKIFMSIISTKNTVYTTNELISYLANQIYYSCNGYIDYNQQDNYFGQGSIYAIKKDNDYIHVEYCDGTQGGVNGYTLIGEQYYDYDTTNSGVIITIVQDNITIL